MSGHASSRPRGASAAAVVAAIALAACNGTTATSMAPAATSPAGSTPNPATTSEPQPRDESAYRIGLIEEIGPVNDWALYGENDTGPLGYVLGGNKPTLFRIQYPGIVVSPLVANGLPADAVQDGDVWTVTQPIRSDFTWSDGSLLTAYDIVFTFETVREAGLGAGWLAAYPYADGSTPRLLDVEALDENAVRFTFDAAPGASVWPHQVGLAPIMPRAPWEAVVARAMLTDDPVAGLQATNALDAGDLSGGPFVYAGRYADGTIITERNDHYANTGFTHRFWDGGSYALNGTVLYGAGSDEPDLEYAEGPFVDRIEYTVYDDQSAAMVGLTTGETDIALWGVGFVADLRRQGIEAGNLAMSVNSNNQFTHLAFNLRKSPGKFRGFRQAMAYLDRESLTDDALQGTVSPIYVLVPEGNRAWYDEPAAEAIASRYRGLTTDERVAAAYAALEIDGFSWTTPPVFDTDGSLVSPGEGMIDPEGSLVADLEILVPAVAATLAMRTAALEVEAWARTLGIPAAAEPMDFDSMVDAVWPGVGIEPEFDMFIIGWTLGNPAWPAFHADFFHSRNLAEVNDGGNAAGYSNPAFDAMADTMLTETYAQTAKDTVWEMERMIAEDLPWVVLYNVPITEFHNTKVHYPFTSTYGGIQQLLGMPELIHVGDDP